MLVAVMSATMPCRALQNASSALMIAPIPSLTCVGATRLCSWSCSSLAASGGRMAKKGFMSSPTPAGEENSP